MEEKPKINVESFIENLHTPGTLINICNNSMKSSTDAQLLHIRGIYKQTGKEEYGGFYYDSLKEEVSEQCLTVRIPVAIRNNITENHVYIFKGFLNRQARDNGNINLVFNVQYNVSEMEKQISYEDMLRTEILSKKQESGYRDVNSELKRLIERGQTPFIHMVVGKNAVTDQDVKQNLGTAAFMFKFEEYRINLSNSGEIERTLQGINKSCAKTDVVVVVRGGGAGLSVFNDIQVGKAGASLNCMLVTAIGHAVDITFLDKIADKSFTTPTEFAKELEVIVRDKFAKEIRKKEEKKKKQLLILLVASLLLIAFLTGFLLGK